MGCGKFHEFHDCSEQSDRMEMLRIFQVAAVFFGILMEKISRVKTGRKKNDRKRTGMVCSCLGRLEM